MSSTLGAEVTVSSSQLRRVGAWTARPVVALLRGWVHPNALTAAGALLSLAAGGALVVGLFPLATALLIIGSCCDWLDGELARVTGLVTAFVGFFDSVLDRISDGAPLIGLVIYFAAQDMLFGAVAAAVATLASAAIPYSKARLETLGHTTDTGILPRAPRVTLVIASVLAGPALASFGVAMVALLGTITVGQRILHAHSLLKEP